MPKSPLPGQRSVGIAAKDLRVEERMRSSLRIYCLNYDYYYSVTNPRVTPAGSPATVTRVSGKGVPMVGITLSPSRLIVMSGASVCP